MQIAQTIQSQLGNGCFFMLGASNLVAHDDGLSFRFKGCRKANYCKVTLDASDTYTMEFLKIGRAPKYTVTGLFDEYDATGPLPRPAGQPGFDLDRNATIANRRGVRRRAGREDRPRECLGLQYRDPKPDH